MNRTIGVFGAFLLIAAMIFFSFVQISFAQTNDDLYGAISSSLGSDDDELISELVLAAAASGITAEDILDPLPPIPDEEGTFVEETFSQNKSSTNSTGSITSNFIFVAFGVGLIIFITLIFALARRFKHEKVRIDRENALNKQIESGNSPMPPGLGQ
jgi:hypothetical protein